MLLLLTLAHLKLLLAGELARKAAAVDQVAHPLLLCLVHIWNDLPANWAFFVDIDESDLLLLRRVGVNDAQMGQLFRVNRYVDQGLLYFEGDAFTFLR